MKAHSLQHIHLLCLYELFPALSPQQVTFLVPTRESVPFEPKDLTPDGHVSLLEFCLFLCQEVCDYLDGLILHISMLPLLISNSVVPILNPISFFPQFLLVSCIHVPCSFFITFFNNICALFFSITFHLCMKHSPIHSSITKSSYCHSAIHPYPHSPTLQLADLCFHCTEYFSQGTAGKQEECFLSETSEAYAFGSNSSSQLAMGTQEKVLQATHMPHMANCQVVSVYMCSM